MASTTLYDTFGNDITYKIDEGTIRAYLVNSTIDFPLPEAASDILAGFVSTTGSIDGALYPLSYFDDPETAIKLTQDGYDAMNNIRPVGNRVSITTATKNSANTRFSNIIQP